MSQYVIVMNESETKPPDGPLVGAYIALAFSALMCLVGLSVFLKEPGLETGFLALFGLSFAVYGLLIVRHVANIRRHWNPESKPAWFPQALTSFFTWIGMGFMSVGEVFRASAAPPEKKLAHVVFALAFGLFWALGLLSGGVSLVRARRSRKANAGNNRD